MTTSNEIDILDTDVSSINTDFPILAPGLQAIVVDACEKVRNKADSGDNLKITVKTLHPAVTKEGEAVAPGFKLTTNVSLTPTEAYTSDMVKKAVATVLKSCGLASLGGNPANLVGKTGTINVTVKPAKGEYPEGNNVRFVVK